LPLGDAGFIITRGGSPVNHSGHPVVSVPLRDPGSYSVALSAPEHQSAMKPGVSAGPTQPCTRCTPACGTSGSPPRAARPAGATTSSC
jgi:hypothetical protein